MQIGINQNVFNSNAYVRLTDIKKASNTNGLTDKWYFEIVLSNGDRLACGAHSDETIAIHLREKISTFIFDMLALSLKGVSNCDDFNRYAGAGAAAWRRIHESYLFFEWNFQDEDQEKKTPGRGRPPKSAE